MKGDEWVIYNFVLKSAQIVVEGDDVFFKSDATSKCDPALAALNSGAGDRKPFMKFFWSTDKFPYFFGAALYEVAATNGSHS